MGAQACGDCNTTGPNEMTAQSSRAQAAPLPRAFLGCAHGARRPAETRGVRVAPDAAQEHAASSAAERSGTLAQAEAAPHAQARRESSRRDAQRSCNPLVHRGTRQARGQRAAWRRSAAQRGCDARARQKHATEASGRARAAWRDSLGAGREPLDSGREHRAPEGFSTRGCKHKGSESHVGGSNSHDAEKQRLQSLGTRRETMLSLTVQDEGGASAQIYMCQAHSCWMFKRVHAHLAHAHSLSQPRARPS